MYSCIYIYGGKSQGMFRYVDTLCLLPLYVSRHARTHTQARTHTEIVNHTNSVEMLYLFTRR